MEEERALVVMLIGWQVGNGGPQINQRL